MASGADRFVRSQLARTAAGVPEFPSATITVVTAGGASDGNALVTVDYLGSSLKLRYLNSYTPVVGHQVALVRHAGDWLILGRPIGFPP